MFMTINVIVAIVLCAIEIIYFGFILPNKPIKMKETDTIQKIRKSRRILELMVILIGALTVPFFYCCVAMKAIIGVHVVEIIILGLCVMNIIPDRMEKKEEILKAVLK